MKLTLLWPPAEPLHPDPSKGTTFNLTMNIYQADGLEVHTVHTARVSYSTCRAKYGPYFLFPADLTSQVDLFHQVFLVCSSFLTFICIQIRPP